MRSYLHIFSSLLHTTAAVRLYDGCVASYERQAANGWLQWRGWRSPWSPSLAPSGALAFRFGGENVPM